jgi:O-methyltransferase
LRVPFRVERVPAPGRLGRTHPDLDQEFATVHARCAPFTMTSVERMYAVWQSVRHVCRLGVEGDVVECGVWRGGSSMVAALTLQQEGDAERRLWLFDTFEGMTQPTARDVRVDGVAVADHWDEIRARPNDAIFAYASLEDVQANVASTGVRSDRVEYVRGRVEQTIPSTAPDRIAVLRLDTDWYESTRHELEHLWDRVEPGGVLLLDDYGHWAGAREAVDEFFDGRPDAPLLTRVDYTGRIGIKR